MGEVGEGGGSIEPVKCKRGVVVGMSEGRQAGPAWSGRGWVLSEGREQAYILPCQEGGSSSLEK